MSQQQLASEALETFSVTGTAESATQTRITTRGFEFLVDEPEALGGKDAAPNPVEYLLGAWAGCLNVVAHQVADEWGLEIDSLEIALAGDLDPRKFLGETGEPRAGYQEVRLTVDVGTDADAETVEEWFTAVEERCPVSDNVTNETPVHVSLSRN